MGPIPWCLSLALARLQTTEGAPGLGRLARLEAAWEVLYGPPDIEDVQVIGVPDERFGEQLCAWIKLRDGTSATTEQIQDFCKGQIAHFKIPHYVKIVDSFPMTVTGKVQKFMMREQMIEELELREQRTA